MYKTFAAAEAKNDGGEAGFDQQREKQLKEAFFAREEKLKDFARSVYSVSIELVQALDRARNGESVRDKFMDYARHRLSSFNDVLSAGGKNVGSNLISAVPQQRNPLRKLDYTGDVLIYQCYVTVQTKIQKRQCGVVVYCRHYDGG